MGQQDTRPRTPKTTPLETPHQRIGTLSNGAHVFQLSVVPAPAGVALLGLAGLAATRRRRA